MTRIKRGTTVRKRHKKVLSQASGYFGRGSTSFKVAVQRLDKAMQYQYRDRKRKKRELLNLWIQRINNSSRLFGLSYSKLIELCKTNNILLNKKILSNLSLYEPLTFGSLLMLSR